VTTSAANDLIVGVFGIAGNATFTAPSGMLERYDVTNAGAGGPATEAADVTQASVGASGDKIATASASARWVGQLVALRAAPPNISGLGKVQVSVQATSGATSGKYWDPAANGGVGGFTGSNELLLPATGTSSWSLAFPSSNFTDGTYTVKAYAIDNVGNFAGVSAANVTIDNVAPTPTLTAPTGGSVTSNTRPTFSGVAGTASGDLTAITVKVYNGTGTGGTVAQTLSATASAGTWSVTPTAAQALADGIYTAQASQSDTVGNSGTSAAVTFTVNTAAPSITATPSSPSANTAPTISFGHGVYSSFQCSLDGAPFAACASPKALSGLGNGSHTFSVKALDSQSNATQTASYTWTVDTSAPTISAKPANPSAATSPSFSFSQPSYTSYECSLDGAAFASCTSPKSYSTADGSHTFSVRAIDPDGIRTSAASYTWTQTTTAPSITAKPTSTSASKTPSFSFSETGYSAFQCQVDSGGFASCASPFTTATLADGAHSFNVRAVDGNGVSTAAATYGWTVNSTAPTITSNSGLTAGGTYASTSASFSFSHAVYSAFQCFLEGGSFGVCAVPTNFTGLADGTHTLTAAATDADNVRTSSSTFSWTVKNAAPTISSQPANPTNTTNGSFSFSEPPFTSFECKVDAGSFAACTSPFSTGALSGSGQTGTSHSFQVHALDTLNNQTQNQSATWTIDTTAPTLGAISDSSSASNRDTISGSTNENGGTVTVRIYTGTSTTGTPVQTYTTTTYGGSSPAFTWSITTKSNDLNGGSQYTAVATQADAAGNASTNSRSVTFNAH
jgi:hypothetical protein